MLIDSLNEDIKQCSIADRDGNTTISYAGNKKEQEEEKKRTKDLEYSNESCLFRLEQIEEKNVYLSKETKKLEETMR